MGFYKWSTIWPGFLALEHTTEAGCRVWLVFIAIGHRSLLIWASGLITKRDRNRILKEARGTSPTPPARDRVLWAWVRKSELTGPGSATIQPHGSGKVASHLWALASLNCKERELNYLAPKGLSSSDVLRFCYSISCSPGTSARPC